MPADTPFLRIARERILVLDGAMGTSLHRYKATDRDWGHSPSGKSLMNLSDTLVYTHPEWIREIHRGYFGVGCDASEQQIFAAALAESQQRFLAVALAEDGVPISAGWLPSPSAGKPIADSSCNTSRAG